MAHFADQGSGLLGDRGASRPLPLAFQFPKMLKQIPVPAGNCIGLNDTKRLSPLWPKGSQYDPEDSVLIGQGGHSSFLTFLQRCKLLSECDDLEFKICTASEAVDEPRYHDIYPVPHDG